MLRYFASFSKNPKLKPLAKQVLHERSLLMFDLASNIRIFHCFFQIKEENKCGPKKAPKSS